MESLRILTELIYNFSKATWNSKEHLTGGSYWNDLPYFNKKVQWHVPSRMDSSLYQTKCITFLGFMPKNLRTPQKDIQRTSSWKEKKLTCKRRIMKQNLSNRVDVGNTCIYRKAFSISFASWGYSSVHLHGSDDTGIPSPWIR